MKQINLNRQLLGLEDLLFGIGTVLQTRAGQQVEITKINAGNLPFNETQSLIEWAQSVNLEELGAMTLELQALYNNLTMLDNVENNLTMLNSVNSNLVNINKVATNEININSVANNQININIVSNDTTEINALAAITTELHTLYANISAIQNNNNNMGAINSLHTNMTALLSIYTNIVPNLTEILNVDTLSAQVAQDKIDVAAMKTAVETIYDTFDDRFLGAKTTDPTLDNDGNPLIDGAMYFNSSSNSMKVYDLGNTIWVTIPQIYLSGLLDVTLTSITTGDLLTWNGSKWVNTRTPSFDSIKLNGGTGTSGTATWNNTEYTYDIVLNPNVTLQVGQEDLVYCKNNSASVIANGRPVMASGTNGNSGNILVDLHDGTKANARRIVGIATEDLTANGYGFVTSNGKVRGINTTGSQYGETWANGDILYVKATGNLTKVEPADTELKMPIAFVIHAHTNGTLYIRTTGIDENHDRDFINNLVDIHSKTEKTTLVDADEFMTADSTSTFSLKKITWASIKTLLVNLFISKVTSTDNAVVRFNGTTGEVQNSGVIIDDNGNLNITGTGARITGDFSNATYSNRLAFQTSILNGNTIVSVIPNGTATSGSLDIYNSNSMDIKTQIGCNPSESFIRASQNSGTDTYLPLTFHTGGTERMRINTAGNVGIGTSNPATALNVNTASETKCALYLQKNLSSVALIGAESTWLGTGTSNNAVLAAYGTNSLILGTGGTERMRIDTSGNVGIGVTPSAWSNGKALEIAFVGNFIQAGNASNIILGNNSYYNSGWKYANSGTATNYTQISGAHQWQTAPSGTAGSAITWTNAMVLDTSGKLLLQSGTGGLGYGTGAGGTVTQLTSKSTAVTLNKPSGTIIMNNAALTAGASVDFLVNNTLYTAGLDGVFLTTGTYGSNYSVEAKAYNTNQFLIRVKNITGGSLSEALTINFIVIKGANS